MNETILEVAGLSVVHHSSTGLLTIVDDISFVIHKGEMLALIGESGTGKTTIALALTGLFHRYSNLTIDGKVIFMGQNLTDLSEDALSRLRANSIRHIFQEPMQSFNPVVKIRKQFSLAQSSNTYLNSHDDTHLDAEWLKRVGIPNPFDVLDSYPHQLSGGTLQRVLIAMAMASHPQLILADEPTSSLDAHLKMQIIDLLESFRKEFGTSILLITHDLKIAEHYADTIAVLYAGQIVEIAERESFFKSPMHPYSQALLRGIGKNPMDWRKDDAVMQSHPCELPSGCKFRIRCPKARNECSLMEPLLAEIDNTTGIRCFFWK
jgi:oligopeptide/dipeptide ABC transporter ATP-binding protein